MEKYIYLPIEIKVREFYSKLYLCHTLAENGFTCIFGSKKGVHDAMLKMPKGIYFTKDIAQSSLKYLLDKKKKSQHIVSLDEEAGIAITKISSFYKKRISEDTLTLASKVYCYGNNDFNFLVNEFPEQAQKIVKTGSPRIDLWQPSIGDVVFSDKIKAIKNKYSEFVLINSSIGITSKEKITFLINQALDYKLIDPKETKKKRIEYENRYNEFKKFASIINELARSCPDKKFVLRPHPAERIEDWKKEFVSIPDNLYLDRDGDVGPFIFACEALIHEGCTTAMQALIAKKPTLSINPMMKIGQDPGLNDFPNQISLEVHSLEDLVSYINNLQNLNQIDSHEKIAERVFMSSTRSAAQNIAEDLCSLKLEKSSGSLMELKIDRLMKRTSSRFKKLLNRIKNNLFKSGNKTKNEIPIDKKIPGGITLSEITQFYDKIQSSLSGNNSDVKVKKILKNTFMIYK